MNLAANIQFTGEPAKLSSQIRDLEGAGVDVLVTTEIYGFDLV